MSSGIVSLCSGDWSLMRFRDPALPLDVRISSGFWCPRGRWLSASRATYFQLPVHRHFTSPLLRCANTITGTISPDHGARLWAAMPLRDRLFSAGFPGETWTLCTASPRWPSHFLPSVWFKLAHLPGF